MVAVITHCCRVKGGLCGAVISHSCRIRCGLSGGVIRYSCREGGSKSCGESSHCSRVEYSVARWCCYQSKL